MLDWITTGIIFLIVQKTALGITKLVAAGVCFPLFFLVQRKKTLSSLFIPFVIICYIILNIQTTFVDMSFYVVQQSDGSQTKDFNSQSSAEELILYNSSSDIYIISQACALFSGVIACCPINWIIQSICFIILQAYYVVYFTVKFGKFSFHYSWILGLFLQIIMFYLSSKHRNTEIINIYKAKQRAKQFKHLLEDHFPNRVVVLSATLKEILFFNKAFGNFFSTMTKTSDQIITELNKFKTQAGSFINFSLKSNDSTASLFYNLFDVLAHKLQLSPLSHKNKENAYKSLTLTDYFYTEDPKNTLFDINVIPVHWNDSYAYMLLFTDVTEKMMVNRMKLEEIFKDRFLASFSHEFRTPLNCMLGFISVLKQRLTNTNDIEALNTIDSSAKVLLTTIDSLLDVMSLEKDGKLKLNVKQVKITNLMHEMHVLVKPYLQNKNVKFIVNIDNNVPENVYIDEERVREVLLHLLLNAIKFTYKGHILLSVEQSPGDSDLLVFHVEDTGIGIKPEDISGLFKINIEQGINMYSKGIGLGLTVSHKLAKVLGKHGLNRSGIQVESQHAKGSKFSITVCSSRDNLRTVDTKQNDGRYNSTSEILIKEKLDLSYQSDARVPSERGNFDKKIRVFKTHESIEFGKSDYTENFPVFSIQSPQHKGINEMRVLKFGKLLSQTEIKLDQPLYQSPKSEISNDLSEEVDEIKFDAEELSSRLNPIVSKHAPEKMSKFSSSFKKDEMYKGRVLVVDDSAFNLVIATNFLKDLGFTVATACNGKEAVEIAERESKNPSDFFKVIFMDCQMPVMDGYEATQILKDKMMKNQVVLTPIVAITANKNQKDIDKCFESGMDAYLSKPVTKEILRNQIKELLPDLCDSIDL